MTTLALVTRARKVAQARWEHAQRVKRIAIAAERRYQALLYELYAEEEAERLAAEAERARDEEQDK